MKDRLRQFLFHTCIVKNYCLIMRGLGFVSMKVYPFRNQIVQDIFGHLGYSYDFMNVSINALTIYSILYEKSIN